MNDLEDLANTFKEVDVSAISLAVDSGRLQQRNKASLWMIWGMVALVAGAFALATLTWLLDPTSLRKVAVVALMGVWLASITLFARRQQSAWGEASEALLGSGADVVRGRIQLLDMELHAWNGRIATGSLLAGLAVSVASIGVGLLIAHRGMALTGVATTFGVAAFGLYGYRVRVPLLTREIAELQALVRELEE